jgi:two-component sensor histidine kinase
MRTQELNCPERLRVGLVAPEQSERRQLKQWLTEQNADAIEFESAKMGLRPFLQGPIHVLLFSGQVSPRDAQYCIEYSRPAGSGEHIPAVVIVDAGCDDPIKLVRALGCDDFISRPYCHAMLGARLRFTYQQAKHREENEAASRRERLWLETIRKASELVTQAHHIGDSFSDIAGYLRQILPLNQFVISLEENNTVHYEVVAIDDNTSIQQNFAIRLDRDSACQRRLNSRPGEKIVCDRVRDKGVSLAEDMQSCVCLPLFDRDKRLGALSLSSRRSHAFDSAQLRHLESLALQVAHAVANIQRYQQMRSEAERLAVIVREVHHRIKNNLQGVIGLFDRYRDEQPQLAPALNSAIAQLNAVAEVHNQLSHHTHETVSWHSLIQGVWEVTDSLSPHRIECSLATDTAHLTVAAGEAVPLALALNELIQNAINHGYPDGRIGTIRLSTESAADGAGVWLRVANNGVPPPKKLDSNNGDGFGLGLDLVQSLLPDNSRFQIKHQDDWTVAEVLYPDGMCRPQSSQ